MLESDLKVMSEPFSVKLGKDACARLGSDERQEVANRFFKTMTNESFREIWRRWRLVHSFARRGCSSSSERPSGNQLRSKIGAGS